MPRGIPPEFSPPQPPAGCEPYYQELRGGVTTWSELPDGRKHGPYIEWYSRVQKRLRGQYQFGGRTGTWTSWSPEGIRLREIEFWEGDLHGQVRFWYQSGQPWKRGHYFRNLEHGHWEWYRDGGGLWLQGEYQRGRKHGVWRQYGVGGEVVGDSSFQRGTGCEVMYFDSGVVRSRIDYVDGIKHGHAVCWYESGQRAFVQGWQRGVPAGRWVTWDESGAVIKVEEYTSAPVGDTEDTTGGGSTAIYQRRWRFLPDRSVVKVVTKRLYAPDEATEILRAEADQAGAKPHLEYQQGEITELRDVQPEGPERLQKFYRDRNGTLLRIETFADARRVKTTFYRDGEPYRIQRWHPTGNLASEGELYNLERTGTWTHWHDNGQRSFVGAYVRGVPDGHFQRWNRDGQMIGEFRIGGGTGTWRDWYDDGRLREEGRLVDGLEQGAWTYYRPDGRIDQVVEYERGQILHVDGDDTIVT